MSGFVNVSVAVLSVLVWCARICIILLFVSFIVKKILKEQGHLEGKPDKAGSALWGKIAKWSSKSWGQYTLGFYWWLFLGICVLIFIAAAYAGLATAKTTEDNYHPPVTEEISPADTPLPLDEDITPDPAPPQEGDGNQ